MTYKLWNIWLASDEDRFEARQIQRGEKLKKKVEANQESLDGDLAKFYERTRYNKVQDSVSYLLQNEYEKYTKLYIKKSKKPRYYI